MPYVESDPQVSTGAPVKVAVTGAGMLLGLGAGVGILLAAGGEQVVDDGPLTRKIERDDLNQGVEAVESGEGIVRLGDSIDNPAATAEALEAQRPAEFFPYDVAVEFGAAWHIGNLVVASVLVAHALLKRRFGCL